MTDIKSCPKNLPSSPGIYIMKDAKGVILYIGKAKQLKHRVAQYFSKEATTRYQIQFLMKRVADIEVVVTDTEKEALLLENTFIKKHKPRYNLDLRDDKSYLSLKLSIKDDFPRLYMTRAIKKDGGLYFGPYTSAMACRDVVDFIEQHFCLRTCSDRELSSRSRPCLQYQIHRCDAPCVSLIDRSRYAEIVEEVRLFLSGKNKELKKTVEHKMQQAARAENFEKAAHYRDLFGEIDKTLEQQKVVHHHGKNQDFVALYQHEQKGIMSVMTMRGGDIIGTQHFPLPKVIDPLDVMGQFLLQYYHEERGLPKKVFLNMGPLSQRLIEEVLSEKKGSTVSLVVPQRGEQTRLVALTLKNATIEWERRQKDTLSREEILDELHQKLHLQNVPRRMECYDISNIQGKYPVGSGVMFVDGMPHKVGYRHYKIKGDDDGPNDFLMMWEVLQRRFSSSREAPHLLIVDGGKGQLAQALKVFEELDITGIDVIGLAKKAAGEKQDKIFLPGRKNPVLLPPKSAALRMLMQIRDEAHRFAITHHRKLRSQPLKRSQLDQIPGIGKTRRNALLKHFGSLEKMQQAPLNDLRAVSGMSESLAQRVYDYCRGQ